MLQSHIVEIDGVFVGTAIRLDAGFRFIAIDPRVEEIGETIWPTLADIHRLARQEMTRGMASGPPRMPPRSAPRACDGSSTEFGSSAGVGSFGRLYPPGRLGEATEPSVSTVWTRLT